QFVGTAADAFGSAIGQLTSLSEQRMGVFDQIIGGLGSCADGASSAVDSVLGAGLDEGLLGKLLEHFDLIDVILNGESVVQAAISALEQTLMDDISNPLSLLSDLVSAVADMMGGLPITMMQWASEIYSVAQEVMQVINTITQVVSLLSDLGNPIQDLFGALPGFGSLLAPAGGIMSLILGVGGSSLGLLSGDGEDDADLFGGDGDSFGSVLDSVGQDGVSDLGGLGDDGLGGTEGMSGALDDASNGVLNDLGVSSPDGQQGGMFSGLGAFGLVGGGSSDGGAFSNAMGMLGGGSSGAASGAPDSGFGGLLGGLGGFGGSSGAPSFPGFTDLPNPSPDSSMTDSLISSLPGL
ncbi:MAG TPA: hypothetical protein VKQ36_11070, partial [Ktedonobacterales bacterium]|nr:hypothetical protein [Ktedonobacterales bacterium]